MWPPRGNIVVVGRAIEVLRRGFMELIIPIQGLLHRPLGQMVVIIKGAWSGARGVVKVIEAVSGAMAL